MNKNLKENIVFDIVYKLIDYNLSLDKDERVTFEFKGTAIEDPSVSECKRFSVNIIDYYGIDNMFDYCIEILNKLRK